MRPEQLRASLQSAFLILCLPVLSIIGLGCFCYAPPPGGSDSSHEEKLASMHIEDTLAGPGLVMRYQYMRGIQASMTQGESQATNNALPGFFFGLRIPTSPSGSQPGQLLDGASAALTNGRDTTPVLLKKDAGQAARLDTLFPPAPGTDWVALTFSDTQTLGQLFQGPVTFTDLDASFSYAIDFGGSDPCNGCEVQFVTCMPGKFGALLPPGVSAAFQTTADPSLLCMKPFSTYITLYNFSGDPLPGAPLIAAFGLWGGQPMTTTTNSAVVLPLTLEHTGATTLTFTLDTIQSALGWSYRWEDRQAAPITQIDVPRRVPFAASPVVNVQVAATGLPTCTQAIDVISLQATSTVTPSLQAKIQGIVSVLPDAATCPVADVATHHIQATDIISAGNGITYTLTISNLTASEVDAIVQQTITPASAVGGADLPAGCTRAGAIVTCQVDDIAAQGAKAVTVVIRSSNSYAGDLSSSVQASPVGAADPAFLDNVDGPLTATIQANGNATGIYLPQLNTGQ